MQNKLNRALKVVKSFLPQRLPQSEAAMLRLCEEVCDLGKLPNNNSFKQAIATSIMHVGQDSVTYTQRRILNGLRRSIANQVSYNILQIIKEEQKNEAMLRMQEDQAKESI